MLFKFFTVICFLLFLSIPCLGDGILTLSMGKVDIKNDGSVKWVQAKINQTVLSSDSIRVGKKSKAVIKLSDGTIISVPSMKVAKLSELEAQKASGAGGKGLSQLIREKGIKLAKSRSGDPGGVTAVAGVRGADVDSQKERIKPSQLKWKD